MTTWMLYGATGYTGRLIAEAAAERGLRPVIAGRTENAVRSLGDRLGLPTRVFPVEEAASNLEGIGLVLHCAGPFVRTYRPMIDACLQAGAHYLDITGEMSVFEAIYAMDAALAAAGLMAIPGVGADVVPTDCLAAMLKAELPDANSLKLALSSPTHLSAGTVKSMIGMLEAGGAVRLDDRLVKEPIAKRTQWVRLGDRKVSVVSIPLADLASAARSTRIPNIVCYAAAPPGTDVAMRALSLASPVVKLLQGPLEHMAGMAFHGPSVTERTHNQARYWGEVENAAGVRVTMEMTAPEPYAFTVLSALASVEKVLAGHVLPGARTPSQAFGADFVKQIPGVTVERPETSH